MNVLGLILILFMGFTLGLLGGGGSILSVPILVYVFKLSAVKATSYSLFIVGCSALIGTVRNLQKNNVDILSALTLALPGFLGVAISRRYIVPGLPEEIFRWGTLLLSKDSFLLMCFAALMVMASHSMFFGRKTSQWNSRPKSLLPKAFLGLGIGILTGFVGAGGGFIIVPVLVNILGVEMKRAIGTSLMVISINSIFGFLGGAMGKFHDVDFMFLVTLSTIGALGILVGIYGNQFVPAKKLKKGFGVFVFSLGLWIIYQQIGY